jgi:hypothetical protein
MKKEKNIHAVELGKRGGLARAKSLSPERRLEISKRANEARKEKK